MKTLHTYINEAQKWDEWEREFYTYRKENGFTGTIDDLVTDENGFSSELAMDFYQLFLQTKKDKQEQRKYEKSMSKMIDSDEALNTECWGKKSEEIAWLIASAINSPIPVEKQKITIPRSRGMQKSAFKVNFKGIDIFIYDKCYKLTYSGYSAKQGFSVLCSPEAEYEYHNQVGNLIYFSIYSNKYGEGFNSWLSRRSNIGDLIDVIEKRLKDLELL